MTSLPLNHCVMKRSRAVRLRQCVRHGKCIVLARQDFCVESSSDVFVPNSVVIKTCDRLTASGTCRRLRIRLHFGNHCGVRGVRQTNWGQTNEDRQNIPQPDSASSKPTHGKECDWSVALVASNIECERQANPVAASEHPFQKPVIGNSGSAFC